MSIEQREALQKIETSQIDLLWGYLDTNQPLTFLALCNTSLSVNAGAWEPVPWLSRSVKLRATTKRDKAKSAAS